MNSLLLSQNDSFSELSKLADLGEKNVQKENRERKKKFACTEALSEKQGDRWDSRGRLRGEEGEDENWEQRGLLPTRYSVVHVWVSSKVYLICSYQAELCNSKADQD